MELWLKYLSVIAGSMFKFLFGPLISIANGLSFLESCILTIIGMMTSAILLSLLGEQIKKKILNKYFKPKRLFTKNRRRTVRIWRKYGLAGVAFLTPVIFMPIGGPLIATYYGENWKRIVPYMFVSAVFWSPITTGWVYFLGDVISGS
jgi:membrane protein DedA with SNARE-associated domain